MGTRLACHVTEGEIAIYLLSISCSYLAVVMSSFWSSSLNNISVMYLQPIVLATLHSIMLACKFFHSKVVWYSLTRAWAHPPLTWNILVLSSWLLVLVSLSVLGCLYPEEVGRALCITWLFYLEIRLGSASIYHDSFCRIFWPILHTKKKNCAHDLVLLPLVYTCHNYCTVGIVFARSEFLAISPVIQVAKM